MNSRKTLAAALSYTLFFALGAALAPLIAPSTTTAFTALESPHCASGAIKAITSPGSANDLLSALYSAKKTIDVEMYAFTASELKKALADAVKRGVKVRVILEPRIDANLATAEELRAAAAEVRWASTSFANTHSKLAIIDEEKVLVGSINWSKHALYENREAELLVEDEKTARDFTQVFEEDWSKASKGAS